MFEEADSGRTDFSCNFLSFDDGSETMTGHRANCELGGGLEAESSLEEFSLSDEIFTAESGFFCVRNSGSWP